MIPEMQLSDGCLDSAGMGYVFTGHRTRLRCGDGCDGDGVAVERHELDHESFPLRMDVYDRADVACLQVVLFRDIGCKHDQVVFFKHAAIPWVCPR